MSDLLSIWKSLVEGNNLVVISALGTAILAFIAYQLPKLRGQHKRQDLEDSATTVQIGMVNGLHHSYEAQLKSLVDRVTAMDQRITSMDSIIHDQAVRLTKLQMLVIQLNSLLAANGVKIPDYMVEEIKQLIEGD